MADVNVPKRPEKGFKRETIEHQIELLKDDPDKLNEALEKMCNDYYDHSVTREPTEEELEQIKEELNQVTLELDTIAAEEAEAKHRFKVKKKPLLIVKEKCIQQQKERAITFEGTIYKFVNYEKKRTLEVDSTGVIIGDREAFPDELQGNMFPEMKGKGTKNSDDDAGDDGLTDDQSTSSPV